MDQIHSSLLNPFAEGVEGVLSLHVPQIITKEMEDGLGGLLRRLNGFQVRTFQTKPQKAKTTRRLIYGMKEVVRKVDQLKAIIFAKDIDEATLTCM